MGLSSGLYYAPGSYATTDEVIALAKVAAEFGGVYSSHIRDEADYSVGVVAAVQEVIRIAEEAPPARRRLAHEGARARAVGPVDGVDHAHRAGSRARRAGLRGSVSVRRKRHRVVGGAGATLGAGRTGARRFVRRLAGAERERIKAAIADNLARRGGPDTLVISGYAPDPSLEGQVAGGHRRPTAPDAVDLVVSLLEKSDGGLVSFNMAEPDIAHIMRQPWTMTCTDGDLTPPGQGKPHPRGYGAFARKLGVYVREREVVGSPMAVRSMTSLPAQVFGLKDRGVIRRGARADLVIFDPADDSRHCHVRRAPATGLRRRATCW